MKIDIYSDLHVDAWRRKGYGHGLELADLFDKNGDYAIFAGDAGNGMRHYDDVVEALTSLYGAGRVFAVPGNHDYYGHEYRSWKITSWDDRSCQVQAWEGLKIGGCTYWTDFRGDSMVAAYASRSISDWLRIPELKSSDVESWLIPHRLNRMAVNFLLAEKPDIIVTHFAPTIQSIHPEYEGDKLNPYFVNDHETLVKEIAPKLWVHGHTHNAFDYMVSDTRVVCNPLGYPGEKTDYFKFKPKMVEV